MKLDEYSTLAVRTAGTRAHESHLLNAALGVAGEGGEIADCIKKVVFHGKPLDRTKLLAEIGDDMWYLNLLVHTLGSSWDEVLAMNIAKLETRYPDLRFNPDHANNRDIEAEERVMLEAVRAAGA